MGVEVRYTPSALALVRLRRGEEVTARTGAMTGMSAGIEFETQMSLSGIFGFLGSLFGADSLILNKFIAREEGELALSSTLPGDISAIEIKSGLLINPAAYLASSTALDLQPTSKDDSPEKSDLNLKAVGTGTVLIAGLGSIHIVDLKDDEGYVVDCGYLAASDPSVRCEMFSVGGWTTKAAGGEGVLMKLTGPGRIYLQTHSAEAMLAWLVTNQPS